MPSPPPNPVPAPPSVTSPSPTPSDASGRDDYFPPTTRSQSNDVVRISEVEPIEEHADDSDSETSVEEEPDLNRARKRRRTSQLDRRPMGRIRTSTRTSIRTSTRTSTKTATMTTTSGSITTSADRVGTSQATLPKKSEMNKIPDEQTNAFLSPNSANPTGLGAAYWRSLSRSPSPLGLIPIHREWRAFVHKHEVPRKALHVSIGFVTLYLYHRGVQPTQIHPVLMALLVPIFSTDLMRFRWPAFNQFYIRAMGALMRESEAHDRFNGVISYLAGLWVAARFCRKDVFVMSVLLLSWCDTAASTFGRLWGKYTPRIRRGKSLAGSIAAFVVGVGAAALFWGFIAPRTVGADDVGENSFAFQGVLALPQYAQDWLGLSREEATIAGPLAVAIMSFASGLIASVSEVIDILGLDDNLTIPVLCGLGLGAFLSIFGGS